MTVDADVLSVPTRAAVRCAQPEPALASMPADFWQQFAADTWEKRPVALPRVMSGPLVSEQDLLVALQAGADGARAGLAHAMFTVWVGGSKQVDMAPFLPLPADASLRGYLGRIDALVKGAEFTVLLANPHLFSDHIALRTRGFLQGLFDVTGHPCGGYDSGIFLGRYSTTPFGVHRGQMSVMTFPVLGRKRFLMWPRGYGDAHADIRDAVRFDAHLPAAMDRSVVAGDLLYWPADIWHVADDAPDFTAALNVGFWWDRPPLNQALLKMSERLAEVAADDPGADALRNDDGSRQICLHPAQGILPAELQHALGIVHCATRGRQLQAALEESWLAFLSGGGVRDLRPLCEAGDPFDLQPGTRVRASAPGVIRVARVATGDLAFAANGHAIRLPSPRQPALHDLLDRLAAGEPVAHGEAALSGTARRSAAGALDLAVRARALVRC